MNATVLDWIAIAPALVVTLTGMLVVGVDLFLGSANRTLLAVLSMAGLAVPAVWVTQRLQYARPALAGFNDAVVLDGLACFLSLAILGATALLLIGAESDTRRRHVGSGEYYGLVMVSAGAMMFLVESADLLMIFLNLEVLSLALYVLTGITRRNPRSNEAAMKYLVTGAFATAFLLLGMAFVYGSTGTLVLANIGRFIGAGHASSPLLATGFGLVIVGFAFKIGAVPFHMWVPDVYEGAPTTTTAFMSVTVKAAGVGALIRVLLIAAPARADLWADLVWWMAVATMIAGNLLAIRQTSVKRMLAYSSIAHTGYALVALATMKATDGSFSPDGAAGGLFYLLVYTFMTLGAFMVLVYLGHEVQGPNRVEWQDAESFDDLAGMGARHPWAAAAMTVFLVSLGGVPPTAGFFGKFALFTQAVAQGHVVLAVIGVLASLVSMYYYLRVVVSMYMLEPVTTDEKPSRAIGWVVALAALATIGLGVQPATFWDWATHSIVQLMG
ncbi:MAG: NADH-quinone oxidoreductase subunit N [Myxococcota bacterium]